MPCPSEWRASNISRCLISLETVNISSVIEPLEKTGENVLGSSVILNVD